MTSIASVIAAAATATASTSLLISPTSDPYPFPSIPDDRETANRNCRLLGPFSLFVQAIMGFVVVGTLVLKRQREKPKRPWKIWSLDISKQMLGQLFVHTLNVLLSSLGSIASEGENNPCSLYFLNIAIDTTIGVLFIYFSMRYLTHYFTDVLGWPGFVSGQYTTVPTVLGRRRRRRANHQSSLDNDSVSVSSPLSDTFSNSHHQQDQQPHIHQVLASSPQTADAAHHLERNTSSGSNMNSTKKNRPRLSFFFRQLSLYLLSLLLMKVMVVLMFALLPFLFDVGSWVLDRFGEHKKAQIFFVMAAFPLAMNTLQFWLIDSLLRHNPLTSIYRSEEEALSAEVDVNGEAQGGYFSSSNGGQSRSHSHWWQGGEDSSNDQRRHQGRHQDESRVRLMGGGGGDDDMAEDEHDDSSRSEDLHAYPPTPSATSSVGQLDAQAKATAETTTSKPADADKEVGNQVLQQPAATDSHVKEPSTRPTEDAAEDDDEDDPWDNWKDDNRVNAKPDVK